jgi:hypothetical protein
MGETLILKTPPEIPEHDLFHAHNIRFTTESIIKDYLGLLWVIWYIEQQSQPEDI